MQQSEVAKGVPVPVEVPEGEIHQDIELDRECVELLGTPARISECLQQGLFSNTPSWELKLSNFASKALPQLQFIAQSLVQSLHVDAGIPREHETHVKHCVRSVFLSAVMGERSSVHIQAMPEVVAPPPTQPESVSQPNAVPQSESASQPVSESGSQSASVIAEPSATHSAALLAFAEKYAKFGISLDKGALHCRPCNKPGFQVNACRDHLVTDAHERAVWDTDWKYEVHLGGGFARRQEMRATGSDSREERHKATKAGQPPQKRLQHEMLEEYTSERKRRRQELNDLPPCPPICVPTGVTPSLQGNITDATLRGPAERRQAVCGGFLTTVFEAGIPLYSTKKMLPWLKLSCGMGVTCPRTVNPSDNMTPLGLPQFKSPTSGNAFSTRVSTVFPS